MIENSKKKIQGYPCAVPQVFFMAVSIIQKVSIRTRQMLRAVSRFSRVAFGVTQLVGSDGDSLNNLKKQHS